MAQINITKLLCVVGPTATGKTSIAVKLAKNYRSILISADSRQVYRGMDIVTGKDHDKSIKLYGTDFVNPDEESSVSVWRSKVESCLLEANEKSKLPIIVGGTGLYVRSVVENIETIEIPINAPLRTSLADFTVEELQNRLISISRKKFTSMNESDRQNPRRLIRAIEVAMSIGPNIIPSKNMFSSVHIIGLKFEDQEIYRKHIEKRVKERLAKGAIEETKNLISKYGRSSPSLTAIGYRSIIRYIDKEIGLDEMVDTWTKDELNYSKRQLVWFKKVEGIVWYEASSKDLARRVETNVAEWYDSN